MTDDDPSRTADPYARLGLPPTATEADIKRAYRALARRHHPDRNPGDPDAERRFKAIAQAYAVLSDPAARRRHDAERGRTTASEEFLADFTDAVERAERIVFSEILPRYPAGRAERVALWARDYATSSVQQRLARPRPGWLARWRARRELRRIAVHIDYRARPSAVAEVWPAATGWAILLYPGAFWARGAREPAELDEAVLTVLMGRVLSIVARQARVDLYGIDGERWEAVVARAREQDAAAARARAVQVGIWGAIAALSALMLYSAWASRGP